MRSFGSLSIVYEIITLIVISPVGIEYYELENRGIEVSFLATERPFRSPQHQDGLWPITCILSKGPRHSATATIINDNVSNLVFT